MEERAKRGEEVTGDNSKRKRRRTFRDVHIVPIVASWLQENYIQDAEGSIAKEGIFNSYVQFCEDNNLTPSKNNIFSKMLKKIFPQIRSRRLGPRGKGVPHYGGISLRSPSSSPARPSAPVSCAARRKRKIQPPSPGSSQEDSDDDYGDEDEEDEEARDGRSDNEAEDDYDGEYDEGDDDYIGSASSPSPKRRVSSTSEGGRYSTRSTRSSAFQDAFSSLSRMAEYEAEDQTSAPPSPLSFDITLPSSTNPSFSVSSLSGETASHLPPAAQLEPQHTLSEGQSAIVMRLVQRFEETILLPHSTFDSKAENSDQTSEWDTFVEFSNLCEHAGLNALKSIFETVLNLRGAIQGNRVTPQSPCETRQQQQPSQSQEQQTLPSTTTTTPSSTASTLNSGVNIAEDLTKLRDWLPSKQSLEAAFSMIRMESGPGPRLMRMWVLSLLAETQMHMGKESTAFRTAQLFMRTLEESIADPPLPTPPFGSGSMDFFEGIANVFFTTGNELYLIRLVSLLLHAKQFDNGLSNCVSTFTRKWNRVLYS